MYISKVEISKYKGFNEATIELVDGLNVILGHNNGGKSTLLDAIALVIDTERKRNCRHGIFIKAFHWQN